MGIETRMEEIAREKGMKTKKQVEQERLDKLSEKNEKKAGLNYLLNAQHKEITVVFLDEKIAIGTLKSFSAYELCLDTKEAGELIIFKHSVKYFYENSKNNGGETSK
jgi:sRNA-binding regulator protein Hfq